MLVLSRGIEDAIVIGDDVEITVLEIKGNTVKLGITAPADVSVNRSEVYAISRAR
jgi:carbon storage regulator